LEEANKFFIEEGFKVLKKLDSQKKKKKSLFGISLESDDKPEVKGVEEVPEELPPLEQPNPAPINNPGVACPICGKVVMPELMAMHVQMKHPNAV
jgi:hypothetical protein